MGGVREIDVALATTCVLSEEAWWSTDRTGLPPQIFSMGYRLVQGGVHAGLVVYLPHNAHGSTFVM